MKIKEILNYIFPKATMNQEQRFYKGRQNWSDQEIEDFTRQLAQVIKWTEALADGFDFENGFYGTVFRQTNPLIDGIPLYKFEGDYTTWNFDDYDAVIFEKLLNVALKERDEYCNIDFRKIDDLGRIICFQTAMTTHDGAPIVESQCFVDEGDVPPIDTWFFLKKNYYHQDYMHPKQTLFCWIPKAFEKVMQQAIDVEILDSYTWLDKNDPQLHQLLKSDLFNL